MAYYCNYDNTGGSQVPQFMRCYPAANIEDSQQQGNQELNNVPEQGIISEFNKATDEDEYQEEANSIEEVPDDEGLNDSDYEEQVAIDNEEGVESTVSVVKPQRTNPCFTRRSFLVLAVLLSCCVIFLIIVVILRSLREPGVGAGSIIISEPFVPADPSTGNSRPLEGNEASLLLEGATCEEHDECNSGLCGGNVAPYYCQPKVGSCQVCHQDRNCLSGSCLVRNGQSICASTADGLMDEGCFCDVDEQCNSKRCEGVFPTKTCRAPSPACTVNEDCTIGVCHESQCRDSDYASLQGNQGERCSGDSDCPSRICVMSSSGSTVGVCSSGEIGSICTNNDDCESERCSQGLCREKQLPGLPCKGNNECDSGICLGFSAFNNGLCLDTSLENACEPEGGTCGSSGKCVLGFCKNFNLTQGSVCTEDSDCQSAACVWSPLRVERICG